MHNWLFIALGGAGGALARYALMNQAQLLWPHAFPFGTLLVNATGSFCIGILYVLIAEKMVLHPGWSSVLSVGFLGAFTTFSTWALETVVLLDSGRIALALGYAVGTAVICVLAAAAAVLLTRMI